jgi:hypothetical protein
MWAELTKITEHDLPEHYDQLTTPQKETLQLWIVSNLMPIGSINSRCTSYGLKHFFEATSDGFYISNGMFKGAMLAAGYQVGDRSSKNWHFNVSQKSVNRLYEWINGKRS